MIRHAIRQIEATEPAIRQIEMHFFAQPPLRPNAQAIPDQQHADQQFGINRRTASVAIKLCKVRADTGQIDKAIN